MRAVGDSGRAQRIIRTLPGHGYQFVQQVDVDHETGTAEGDDLVPTSDADEGEPGSEALLSPMLSTSLPPPELTEPPLSPAFSAVVPPPVSDAGGGERKLVTVFCCALGGAQAGSLGLDIDALYDVMQALYDVVQRVAHPYGGTLQPATGDHVVAIFGAPVAHEDHAQRAALVAFELNRQILENPSLLQTLSGPPLALCIGLCTGLVAVRGIGGVSDERLSVIGETASKAASLCEQAQPRAILCSESTARLLQDVAWVDATALRGRARAEEAVYHLNRSEPANAIASRFDDRSRTDFVNRERELEHLLALFEEVETHQGHTVGVVGEPGIGKSRLTHELRRRLAGQPFHYLQGRCLSYGQATPYLPVLDLLRQRCRLADTDPPDIIATKVHLQVQQSGMPPETWAPYLLWLLGAPTNAQALNSLSPQALQSRIFETLIQLLAAGCVQRALIIEVEDLHWLDPTSEAFLSALVERLPGLRILLLCTYRLGYDPPWRRKSYATQIALRRLAPTNSRRIVQSVLTQLTLSSPLEQALLTKADGNPFFLEELTRSVTEQVEDDAPFTIPETIHAVLAARMDRLPAAEKRLLQVSSVLGKDVSTELLKALTQLSDDDLNHQLSSLQTTEFLYQTQAFPEPIYNFKHALTQDVAYQSLLRQTRRDYHRQIAQIIEERFMHWADTQPERLAHHYTEAGLSQQAILYWQRAGRRAVERSANAEAVDHFSKALELLQRQPDSPARTQLEIELQLALGAPLLMIKGHTAPEVEQAYAWAYELCQQAGDPAQYFSALVGLWRFHLNQAHLGTARQLAEQCLELAEEQQAPDLSQASYSMLGLTLFYLGEFESSLAHLEQSLSLYQAQSREELGLSGGTEPGVVCLSAMAWTLWKLGRWDSAKARAREAIALAETLAHDYSLSYALIFTGFMHQWSRDAEAVYEPVERVIALSTEHGFVRWLQSGLILQGWMQAEQGEAEAGAAQISQSLATFQSIGWDLGMPHLLSTLVEAYRRDDQPEAGLRVLDDALAMVKRTQECCYEAELHRLRGELLQAQYTAQGDLETAHQQAERCFQQAIDIAHGQKAMALELQATMSLSRLWQQLGRQVEAYQLLKTLYDGFGSEPENAALLEAKALLDGLA